MAGWVGGVGCAAAAVATSVAVARLAGGERRIETAGGEVAIVDLALALVGWRCLSRLRVARAGLERMSC